MFDINLPPCELKLQQKQGKTYVFDFLRRKYIILTPEEWVRQHFTHYLVTHLGYPQQRLANEITVQINGMRKRCDTVLYDKVNLIPRMIIEYKAPTVAITQRVFDQIWSYNTVLQVSYLIVTNGREHYACRLNNQGRTYTFLPQLPPFSTL